MKQILLNWKQIETACRKLSEKISKNRYDAVVCIANGGLVPGRLFSEYLNVPLGIVVAKRYNRKNKAKKFFAMDSKILWCGKKPKTKRILIVDDIIDEGITARTIADRLKKKLKPKRLDIAALFCKPKKTKANLADYTVFYYKKTKDWIVFPWETQPV
ncbi:MAG: phosphoribosyltransferase family protein [Candidatus Micrarchaeota archaeon]